MLLVNGVSIETDKEGYLKNLGDWNEGIANALARQEGVALTEEHWEILHAIRDFYSQYEHAPNNRILVKHIRKVLGEEKGQSLYLMKLFPGAPAKLAAKIAGLPRPTHCL